MEVTRKNFNEVLDYISKAINDASFIAFDAEFTGLDTPQYGQPLPFDTPEERYVKLKKGGMDFIILQFGLCTFKFDNKKKKLTAQPFNFQIFPRPYSHQAPDRRFMCQSSSIDFLVSQGFDFNKVFYEGIPYLTTTQEQALLDSLERKHQLYAQFSSPAFTSPHGQDMGPNKGPIAIPDDQKDFINGIVDSISCFMDKNDEQSLDLPSCNGFQRKLIYQTVRAKFTSVHLEAKKGEKKERYICVNKVSGEEDLKMREGAKQSAERAEIDDAIGFSKVIRKLSQSGKVLVGHNMLLDVLHTIDQFHFPLPDEYEDFKSMVKCIFPKLVDTKLMAQNHPFKDLIHCSALNDLHRILSHKPFQLPEVDFPEGFNQYSTDSKFHEAGYDAFITGLCFATMKNFLGSFQKPQKDFVSPTSPLIEPFMNKLFMMRNFEVPYMNLNGPDLQANRDHVFYLIMPKDWKSNDISNLFTDYGNVQVFWIDDMSALVSLYKKENWKNAYNGLSGKNTNYEIRTYQSFITGKKDNENKNHPQRKRHIEQVEEDIPKKKKKSLNAEAAPFISKSTEPMIEGEDSNNSSTSSAIQSDDKPADDTTITDNKPADDTTITPIKDVIKPKDCNKLFEESSSW